MSQLDTNQNGRILFGLLAVSSLAVAAWFGLEEIMLSRDEKPITWFARRALNKYWGIGRTIEAAAMFIVGVAFAHFIIDSDSQPGGK